MKKRKKHLKKSFKLLLIFISILIVITIFHFHNYAKFSKYLNDKKENINISEDLPVYEKIKEIAKYDKNYKKIFDNYNAYPEELLSSLISNQEMLDFVLDYPEKKGKIYADNVGNIQDGIPLLMQWDKRWGYASYGNSILALTGCGPTALAMVITGLTKDNSITPYKVAKFAEDNGYFVNSSGTSWSLMTKGALPFGIHSKEIPLDKSVIYNSLINNHPIICSMGPGDFTKTGHFIVLTRIINGKIKVNDPNSKERSSKLWDYEVLAKQIKNLWEFSL